MRINFGMGSSCEGLHEKGKSGQDGKILNGGQKSGGHAGSGKSGS